MLETPPPFSPLNLLSSSRPAVAPRPTSSCLCASQRHQVLATSIKRRWHSAGRVWWARVKSTVGFEEMQEEEPQVDHTVLKLGGLTALCKAAACVILCPDRTSFKCFLCWQRQHTSLLNQINEATSLNKMQVACRCVDAIVHMSTSCVMS